MKITGLYSSIGRTIFVIGVLVLARGYAQAQCANVQSEYQAESASESKCSNYPENYGHASTPPKYYLQNTITTTQSANGSSVDGSGDSFTLLFVNAAETTVQVNSLNYLFCTNYPTTYSGSASYNETANVDEGGPPGPPYILNESATMDSMGNWNDGGGTDEDAQKLFSNYYEWFGGGECTPPDLTAIATSTTSVAKQSCSGDFYEAGSYTSSYAQTEILTEEFTDDLLRSKTIYFIPAYTGIWITNYANSFGSALYTLDSNHFNASAGRMKYRFHVTDCQPHTSYLVTWDEVTTYPNNSQTTSVQHMQEDVEGTGDPAGVYTSVHERDVPAMPSTITVNNVNVTYQPWDIGGF